MSPADPAPSPAIRRILRAEGGAARRDRLLRETKRAAQVRHEGLELVHEVGVDENGDLFVSVEQSEGERLSVRLGRGDPIEERVAASIATQIARALAVAHDAGVVHRDLRPSLIVLAGEGETTRVKVEGLATPRQGPAPADDAEAAYAAPEQLRGGAVGRRADVYSIGAMLHAMLTGQPPGPGSAPIESALGDVVRRCLAEDPRERFLDTIALNAALRAVMESANPSVSSKPPPSRPRSAPAPAPAPALAPAPAPASGRPAASERPPAASARPSVRPTSVRPPSASEPALGRAPAEPPPRPLGRPLTARPRWEEALLDLRDGPLPRVALTTIAAFAIARILTSGVVPFVVAIAAGVAVYGASYFRKSRPDR